MRTAPDRPGALKTLQDLPKDIKNGNVAPLYVLFGTEEYLLESLRREMTNALFSEEGPFRDLNLDLLDGTTATVDDIASRAAAYPMGAERRVLVVKNPVFLNPANAPTPMDNLRMAQDAFLAGNHLRALVLIFRAMDSEPAPLDSPETREKLDALRDAVLQDAPDLLPFVEEIPRYFDEVPLPEKSSGGSDADRFLNVMEEGIPGTTTILLVLFGKLEGRKKFLDRLRELAVLADVDSLKEQSPQGRDPVQLFIEKRLKDAKLRVEPQALSLFRQRTRDNLRSIVDELEKLIAYVGNRETIELADVQVTVSDGTTTTVFDLTDAIATRNLPKALKSLVAVLTQGEPALKVHALLIRQVRLMLQAHLLRSEGHLLQFTRDMPYRTFQNIIYQKWDAGLVKRLPDEAARNLLKQKPYPLYLILKQASYYSVPELLSAYDILLAADEELKSSRVAEDLVLQGVIERLVAGGRKRAAAG